MSHVVYLNKTDSEERLLSFRNQKAISHFNCKKETEESEWTWESHACRVKVNTIITPQVFWEGFLGHFLFGFFFGHFLFRGLGF